jgi:hypothetical protein
MPDIGMTDLVPERPEENTKMKPGDTLPIRSQTGNHVRDCILVADALILVQPVD